MSVNYLLGGYFAILLVMGLYNLLLFFTQRERSYLYFVGFAFSFFLFHIEYESSALKAFWPDLPDLHNYGLPVFLAINMLSISLFVPVFLRLREQGSEVFRLFGVYSALAIVSVLMLPLMHHKTIVQIQSVLNLLIYVSAFITGARYWLKGLGYTRFFSLAWAVAIVALTLINLRSREIIPTNQYTFYIYQIAVVIEVILLSLALNERSLHKQKHLIQERDYQLVEKDRNIEFLRSYESLYNNSLTGRFQLDKDGYFSKTNTSWRTIIGYNDAAFFAEDNPTFNSLFADSKQRRQFWADLKEQGKLLARVLYFTQPISGERIVVSLSMRKGSGEKAAWYGSGQDVTENYLKQQAILQMQKDKTQSLRQLVLGISHEMNTPLSNIRLARGFLDNDHPEWSEDERERRSKEGIAFIHEGIDRLNELNQLMKSSVIQENQYAGESIIIRDWLDLWSLEVKQKYPTLKLRTAVHSYLIDWPTYPEALAIVLGQLLENSCVHNKELYEKEELKVSVDFRERGDFLELHYQDNGKGVTTEQREQIFMPFFTSNRLNAQNKGLGLYQSYNLITELLQGFIDWPDEAEGFYLIVRFNLPAN